jgi:hypothetical protein
VLHGFFVELELDVFVEDLQGALLGLGSGKRASNPRATRVVGQIVVEVVLSDG